jgi:hypothetical protein
MKRLILVLVLVLGGCGFAQPTPSPVYRVCYTDHNPFVPEYLPVVTYCEDGELK